MFSSSFASVGRSNPESGLLTSMGSFSIEAKSFSLTGVVLDELATSAGALSKEDSIAGEAGRVNELRGADRLRITSFRSWSAWATQ